MGSTNPVTGGPNDLTHSALAGTPDDTLAAVPANLAMSVGAADDTIADVGAAFSQATLNNNFRDVGEKVNAVKANAEANMKDLAAKINAVNGALNIVGVYRDETGGMYLDIQFIADAGTGPAALSAGVHVARVPIHALLS